MVTDIIDKLKQEIDKKEKQFNVRLNLEDCEGIFSEDLIHETTGGFYTYWDIDGEYYAVSIQLDKWISNDKAKIIIDEIHEILKIGERSEPCGNQQI